MPRYGWSTNRRSWDGLDTDALNDWRAVKFSSDSAPLVPQQRGVYLIVLDSANLINNKHLGKFSSPMYAGHTLDLQRRFSNHTMGQKREELREVLNSVSFYWVECPSVSQADLRATEQSLIEIFGPPLNKANSTAPGVTVEMGTTVVSAKT